MSGTVQVFKALGLLVLGYMAKGFLLSGESYSFLAHIGYYLVLIWMVFKYATSYKHAKVCIHYLAYEESLGAHSTDIHNKLLFDAFFIKTSTNIIDLR